MDEIKSLGKVVHRNKHDVSAIKIENTVLKNESEFEYFYTYNRKDGPYSKVRFPGISYLVNFLNI